MKNLKSSGNVSVGVSYTTDELLLIFKEGQDYAKINRNEEGYRLNVLCGKKLYEDNKHMASKLENLVGHKIKSSDDLVAFSLTMQMLVFQEKMNEIIFGGMCS